MESFQKAVKQQKVYQNAQRSARFDSQSDQAGGLDRDRDRLTTKEKERIIQLIGEKNMPKTSSPTRSDGSSLQNKSDEQNRDRRNKRRASNAGS